MRHQIHIGPAEQVSKKVRIKKVSTNQP